MGVIATTFPLILAGLLCSPHLVLCQTPTTKPLYIAFITAHSEQYTALGAVPAVDLALERINSDPTLLPGYNLSYASDVGNSLVSAKLLAS